MVSEQMINHLEKTIKLNYQLKPKYIPDGLELSMKKQKTKVTEVLMKNIQRIKIFSKVEKGFLKQGNEENVSEHLDRVHQKTFKLSHMKYT